MMKKYFLKGKEFITKKLQEFDIETENIDYVRQQIPNRLKQPLNVLMKEEIDLQPSAPYDVYFKNYPTHHLSTYLLEKYQMQIDANSDPQDITLPMTDVFIPKFDQGLEKKGLLLRQVIEQYDEGYTQVDQAIICMNVIHFHHKRGTQIEYTYPKTKTAKSIQDNIVHHAMPDSSHNKAEDYNFFNFEVQIQGKKKMLFGVAYFKQIKVNEQMKKKNPQLTRSYIQKAVSIVSPLPLFGYLKFRLAITIKLFFENFTNFQIIDAAYQDISKHLQQTWPKMQITEMYIGSDLKVIIDLFGVQSFYQIWKAILYQRRIVVFAHSSSSASSFILSMLTLFPGLSPFGMFSRPISRYMQTLREYALPLRLFSSQNFMAMSFHIQDFYLLQKFQKSKDGHFLVGTTNRLLKQQNQYGVELLVNLQNCTIQKNKARIFPWQNLTKQEKQFCSQLEDFVNKQKSIVYGGSEDCIRNHFHNHLKRALIQIIDANNLFQTFIQQCKDYEQKHEKNADKKSRKNSKQSGDEKRQAGQQNENNLNRDQDGDYPPLIPRQVTSIPFPGLLVQKSFTHFLQFHNKKLPQLLLSKRNEKNEEKIKQTTLKIVGNEFIVQNIFDKYFISYNCIDKKLLMCKGDYNAENVLLESKEIRFSKHAQGQYLSDVQKKKVKSIFVGGLYNNKYMKNCFYMDQNEVYEGQYYKGRRHGYGKLTTPNLKYIGNFIKNQFSGDGQLVKGQNLYVGQFQNGLRHGCGKNQGPQINYQGEWRNDFPQGNGILIQSTNQGEVQFIGTFSKSILDENQEVTIRYPNKSMFKGKIKERKPHGEGIMSDAKGNVQQGIFENGVLVKSILTISPLQETPVKKQPEIKAQNQTNQQIKQESNQSSQTVEKVQKVQTQKQQKKPQNNENQPQQLKQAKQQEKYQKQQDTNEVPESN